jgi:EmrB/QacA subfamily drug resistance transporter
MARPQMVDSADGGTHGPGPASAGAPSDREVRAVFIGLMIVLGLSALDQSIVATALPRIVSELGGVARLSWVVTAYVLTSTATMPLYGKLSDQYGRKPALYGAIVVFLLGSALSGAAQSLLQLILFRAIQGVGAGGLLPLSQIIIGDLVPPAERGRRQGAIVAVFAVCSILGPVVGGAITDLLSWHWIFYVNLPIGALSLAVVARALRHSRPRVAHRIDYLGAALLTVAATTGMLVLALGGTEWPWNSPQLEFSGAVSVTLTLLLIGHLRRAPEPILPLDLFRNKLFVVACLVLTLTSVGLFGAVLFFPLFFQEVMGVSPSNSGFLTGPLMIGVVISSVLNGRLLMRSGRYKPAQLVGLGAALAAFAGLAFAIGAAQPLTLIEPAIFVLGLGLGLVMPNMTIAVQNALAFAHRGVGTATLAFFRSLGGLVGATGAGAILSYQLHRAALTGASGASLSDNSQSYVARLSAPEHQALITLYRHAIAMTFAAGFVVVAAAFLALLFLPELPLKGRDGAGGAKS